MKGLLPFFAASAYVAAIIAFGIVVGGLWGVAAAVAVPVGALAILLFTQAEIRSTSDLQKKRSQQ